MSNLLAATLAASLVGFLLGSVFTYAGLKKLTGAKLGGVTRVLFVSIALSAISWVFISYGIAIYSTVYLGQVYTMAELSEPAITGILCVLFAKVLENVFEHNDGPVWGRSNKKEENT